MNIIELAEKIRGIETNVINVSKQIVESNDPNIIHLNQGNGFLKMIGMCAQDNTFELIREFLKEPHSAILIA